MDAQPHLEVELKLRVPANLADEVEAAVRAPMESAVAEATDTELDALYHDTDDWKLSAAGYAWRMRREGDRWVQTLKCRAPGNDRSVRLEHEVDRGPVDDPATPPAIDASLHADVDWGAPLVTMIDELRTNVRPPHAQFRVRVHRVERMVTNEHGTLAIAFDRGQIVAGAPLDDRPAATLEVSELEFELVAGSREAVDVEADRWATRFGLPADLPNKARRGRALADSTRARRRAVGAADPPR